MKLPVREAISPLKSLLDLLKNFLENSRTTLKRNSLMCPDSNYMNPGEYDAVFKERVRIRNSIKRLRIEALLDGKLTVD